MKKKRVINMDADGVLEDLPMVKNWLNSGLFEDEKEVNDQPSITIPDQAMSISEMMSRFARGLKLTDSVKEPVWNDEFDMPDINHMDFAEREEFRQQCEDELNIINERLKKVKDAQNQSAEPSNDGG